jgi:hypothetical protein
VLAIIASDHAPPITAGTRSERRRGNNCQRARSGRSSGPESCVASSGRPTGPTALVSSPHTGSSTRALSSAPPGIRPPTDHEALLAAYRPAGRAEPRTRAPRVRMRAGDASRPGPRAAAEVHRRDPPKAGSAREPVTTARTPDSPMSRLFGREPSEIDPLSAIPSERLPPVLWSRGIPSWTGSRPQLEIREPGGPKLASRCKRPDRITEHWIERVLFDHGDTVATGVSGVQGESVGRPDRPLRGFCPARSARGRGLPQNTSNISSASPGRQASTRTSGEATGRR